jgi:nicotinamidase-related amidase
VGAQLQAVVGEAPLLVCGVATECCVLATALAAADSGRRVQVVADACAGATRQLHTQALGIMDSMSPLLSVVTTDQLVRW